ELPLLSIGTRATWQLGNLATWLPSNRLIHQRLIKLNIDVENSTPRVHAENILLLDRLRRAGAAVSGWPVGGDEDQRRGRVVRFDGGGEELSDGGAGSGDHSHGTAGQLGAAEGEESRGAFVDEGVDAKVTSTDRSVCATLFLLLFTRTDR